MHVFIDTNILLDFFHFSSDKLDALRDVFAIDKFGATTVYLTEQVRDEFSRNREPKISDALKQFGGGTFAPQLPAFMIKYPEHSEIQRLAKQLKEKRNEILEKAKRDIANRELVADEVIQAIFSATSIVPTTSEAYKSARMRTGVGNPPGKPGSLGDAINWILLLESVPDGEDIHVISKDGDYFSQLDDKSPLPFLFDEWLHEKKGELFVYKSLRQFMKSNFADVSSIFDDALTEALYEFGAGMVDSDETICGLIAESNAAGYDCDWVEVVSTSRTEEGHIEFRASMQFTADGPRKDDVPWCGDQIKADISGIWVQEYGGIWGFEDFLIESASLNNDFDDDDAWGM